MEEPFEFPPDVLRRVPLFAELSKVLSWTGGPVNWDLARQVAVSIAAGERATPAVDGDDHAAVAEHARTAELWITETTGLSPSTLVRARAGNAVDWAERAPDAYRELIDPVAGKATHALSSAGGASLGLPPEAAPIAQAIGQIAPMFMGIQIGTIVGTVAQEVTGYTDVAFPAAEVDVLIVLDAVDRFASGYQLDQRQARQHIALREVAHRVLLDSFPWIRTNFFALYHNFVASLDVDLAEGLQKLQQIDLSDPSRLQEALGDGGLFSLEPSPGTAAAAARVGHLLSILDAATTAAVDAAAAHVGAGGGVAEAFRRREIEDRRGARMLYSFIGLDPTEDRRVADAFVRAVLAEGGFPRLIRAWDQPDALPTPEELVDPAAWLRRTA